MRILYLAARFPFPPNRGDRLTGYHFLRTMARRGHAVTLLSFVDGSEPAGARDAIAPWCERIETVHLPAARSWAQAWLGMLSSVPSQVAYYRSAAMQQQVRALVTDGGYDAVFLQLIRMAPFVHGLDHPVKVLFFPDSFALNLRKSQRFVPWWRAPGVAWEASRVERFEVAITQDFRESWLLSPEDARRLQELGGQRVTVVRHGVDETLFDLERDPEPGPLAVFLGNLSVPHNVDAARFAALEVWPLVRERVPDARLRLVGADAGPAVLALAGLPGIDVAGFVPDLRDVWRSAGATLAPLRFSTGIQNKVLEAMAAGVPTVTTPPVADALGAGTGLHLLTAETARALADAMVATFSDPASANTRAVRARAFVREHFTWEESVRRLESLAATSPGGNT